MIRPILLQCLLALGAVVGVTSCAITPGAKLDDKTTAVLSAMSDKLAAAKTLRVNSTRKASPGFHAGMLVAESASGSVVVRRPDKLAAQLKTSEGRRAIGFDGSNLTVVDYAANTHAIVKAPGDMDRAIRGIQKTYGLTPPTAELLVNNPRALMLEGVKSGKHTGTEAIGGVECDRLAFEQEGLSWKLWVATGDKLPRRISLTYPNGEGGAPLTLTADLTDWQLDVIVPVEDLTVKAPAGSHEIQMLPLTH